MIYKRLHSNFFRRPAILFFIFWAIFSCFSLQAQNRQEDVVYLKNGSIIRGTIIENIPGGTVKIQTADRSIWAFKADEIEKMTREEFKGTAPKLTKQKGFYNATTVGLILTETSYFSGTLSMVNGYKWSPYFSTGLFVTMDSYDAHVFIPVGIDVRGEILRSSITPYWYFQAAYPVVIPPSNNWETYKAGMMYQPGAGALFMLNKDVALLTELGLKIQNYTYESRNWGTIIQKTQMRNLTLKIGLQF